MKATIEFILPDEQYEHRQAVHCREAWIALQELDEEMRRIVKHGTQPGDPSTVTALAARDRKSTRLNSSHVSEFRMPSSA